MSEEIIREPLRLGPAASRRNLQDRLTLRFPRIATLVTRIILRLPPRSRLRRALMRRTVASTWQALNRGDLAVTFAFYGPDVVSEYDPRLVSVGFANTSGRQARVELQQEALAGLDLRFESAELVYVGRSQLLSLGRMTGSGRSSGAEFDNDWAALVTFAGGRVVREEIFLDHAEALRAAGL